MSKKLSTKRENINESKRGNVRRGYADIAMKGGSCCGTAQSCCGSGNAKGVARAVGYSEAELVPLPEGANMGLSCGNPSAIAGLKRGEIVLDLGSGGGFDVFIVARKVGAKGRVIGVDMTPEMIAKARKNAVGFQKRTGLDNVEFRLGEIEHLPVADASVDIVISNCVINLSPDKQQVWREIARVLKPGGRVAVSDLALLRPLPAAIQKSVIALVGCIAGAVLVEKTKRMILSAGLVGLKLQSNPDYIDSMTECNDRLYRAVLKQLPRKRKMSDYVTSLDVTARKSCKR